MSIDRPNQIKNLCHICGCRPKVYNPDLVWLYAIQKFIISFSSYFGTDCNCVEIKIVDPGIWFLKLDKISEFMKIFAYLWLKMMHF